MALDIETKGNNPVDSQSVIVGIGLSDKRGSVYLEVSSVEDVRLIGEVLKCKNVRLLGHNLFFDASYLYRDLGYHLNWAHCTYALYKYLATEGYPGQKWGLKDAQAELLGWTETNETALGEWLVANGLKKQHGAPNWAEMWQAPASILGHYCALDSDATYLLFTEVLLPGMRRTAGGRYHEGDYYGPTFIKFLLKNIEQRFSGISISVPELLDYNNELHKRIAESEKQFRSESTIRPVLDEYKANIIAEHVTNEPSRYKKLKVPQEPPRFKKNGEVSINWLKWQERKEAGEFEPRESKTWQNWNEKLEEIKRSDPFNIHSGPQKQWLFYEKLGYTPTLFTDSGQPAVDERALKGFGEPGRLLIVNNELVKEQGYVQAVIDNLRNDKIHLSFRIPGTLTGRLAGASGLNVQQMPKVKGFLETWKCRPNFKIVEFDFTAVEQVVLAELSRDPSLWKLYGPTARPNDIYLFTGAYLPVIGPKIRAAGYDPDNPTPEGINAAKKAAKKERQIAKTVVLGSSYGAGAPKIAQTLRLSGVEITDNEAKAIHSGYWALYKGVKEFEAELVRQWKNNDGWVYNGIGRPIGIAEDYIKDIVNRVIQSTAHDCLILFLGIVIDQLDVANIDWKPWILDWHDELMIEVREDQAEMAARIIDGICLDLLNEKLGGKIKLKGGAEIVDNLAQIKCAE